MRIECPQCGFGRDVADDRLPPAATTATCPRCQHKFRFRQPPEPEPPVLRPVDAASNAAQPVVPEVRPEAPQPPPREPEVVADVPPPQPEAPEPEAEPTPAEDLWQQLENLGHPPRETPAEPAAPAAEAPRRPRQQGAPPPGATIEVPWEAPGDRGLPWALVETLRRILLHPGDFFGYMALDGLARPLAFYLLVNMAQALAQILWHNLGMTTMHFLPGLKVDQPTIPLEQALTVLALLPPAMTIWLFAATVVCHALLRAVRATGRGLVATFRAVAYSVAPLVLACLPFTGANVLGLALWCWSMGIMVVALGRLHRAPYWRVCLALLLPLAGLTLYYLLFGLSGGPEG